MTFLIHVIVYGQNVINSLLLQFKFFYLLPNGNNARLWLQSLCKVNYIVWFSL